jgi:hypothetical protein
MATTDTRSGFRLPWSSDRSHEAPATDAAAEAPVEAPEEPAADSIAWPSSDFNARLGLTSQPRPADATDDATPPDAQEPEMINAAPAPPPAPVAPRKPSKLMVDLSAAIRATAEAARDQSLAQVEADVAAVVEQIRAGSKEGEGALRVRSDEDIAKIKEWSRAEIARIKEQTEHKIDARKLGLDEELAAHAAAIEQRVGEVEDTAAVFRADIEAYTERLSHEDDPARLATMAESMPEPPVLDRWADLDDLELDLSADASIADAPVEDEPEAVAETAEPEAVAAEGWAEPTIDADPAEAEVVVDVAEAAEADEADVIAEATDNEAALDTVEAEAVEADALADDTVMPSASAVWGEAEAAWVPAEPETLEVEADTTAEAGDNVPRWSAGETPEGFPTGDAEAGDPVDRGAIMAALEAAAEAVVAAESAAESADHAEAAADVAETAAELLKGRMDPDADPDPEAAAALSARVGAGGFEESYTDRLASLLPGHGEGPADGEPRATQVVVSGLVSVASIASFKRHLGRLAGVTAVAVASGPDGEFVFNVNHRPDLSFRDALPTMPGFAARVTGSGDGVVHVTARDPESEA